MHVCGWGCGRGCAFEMMRGHLICLLIFTEMSDPLASLASTCSQLTGTICNIIRMKDTSVFILEAMNMSMLYLKSFKKTFTLDKTSCY